MKTRKPRPHADTRSGELRVHMYCDVPYFNVDDLSKHMGQSRHNLLRQLRRFNIRRMHTGDGFMVLAEDWRRLYLLGLPAESDAKAQAG